MATALAAIWARLATKPVTLNASRSGLLGTVITLPGPGRGWEPKNKNLLATLADPLAYRTLSRPLSASRAYPPAFPM